MADEARNPAAPERILSIDALRGFDMFWIMSGDALVAATVGAIDPPTGERLKIQFEHVKWEGFRFEDLIFPLFLFVVGAVIPFSLRRRLERGEGRIGLYGHVVFRASALIVLGLIYNGLLQLDFEHQRYAGVLQRMGICFFFAAIAAMHLGPRGLAALTAALLLGYWAALAWIPVPNLEGVPWVGDYSMEHNLSSYIDQHWLPGRLYYGFGDNEGILSHFPAVATALIGVLAGLWLRSSRPPVRKAAGLVLAGAVGLALGYAWGTVFPIVKNIWTSSFVLVAGGWSLLWLALFYTVIDILGFRRWAFFFIVIGANPITIYLVQRIVKFGDIATFFTGGLAGRAGVWGPVVSAAGLVAMKWLFLLLLYRKKIFLKV